MIQTKAGSHLCYKENASCPTYFHPKEEVSTHPSNRALSNPLVIWLFPLPPRHTQAGIPWPSSNVHDKDLLSNPALSTTSFLNLLLSVLSCLHVPLFTRLRAGQAPVWPHPQRTLQVFCFNYLHLQPGLILQSVIPDCQMPTTTSTCLGIQAHKIVLLPSLTFPKLPASDDNTLSRWVQILVIRDSSPHLHAWQRILLSSWRP